MRTQLVVRQIACVDQVAQMGSLIKSANKRWGGGRKKALEFWLRTRVTAVQWRVEE